MTNRTLIAWGVALVEHDLDEVSPVLPSATLGYGNMTVTGPRLNLNAERGDTGRTYL